MANKNSPRETVSECRLQAWHERLWQLSIRSNATTVIWRTSGIKAISRNCHDREHDKYYNVEDSEILQWASEGVPKVEPWTYKNPAPTPLNTAWLFIHGKLNNSEFCIPVPYNREQTWTSAVDVNSRTHHRDTKLNVWSAIRLAARELSCELTHDGVNLIMRCLSPLALWLATVVSPGPRSEESLLFHTDMSESTRSQDAWSKRCRQI